MCIKKILDKTDFYHISSKNPFIYLTQNLIEQKKITNQKISFVLKSFEKSLPTWKKKCVSSLCEFSLLYL